MKGRRRTASAALAALALCAGEARGADDVYRLHPAADAAASGAAVLALAVPALLASDLIRPSCPCDPAGLPAFDRGAVGNHSDAADVLSTITVGLALAAPPLLDLLDVGPGSTALTDAAVFAETVLVNGALAQLAKYAVQRPLPRTYAGDPELLRSPGGYRSFYSGHTSTAFAALGAAAFTLRQRHGELVWPWLVALAVGSSVAAERVLAGRHFPSDVAAGALAGSAVGIAVPWLHLRGGPVQVAAAPAGRGLAMAMSF